MRIGIDARPLIGQKSGIGHYLEQILLAWVSNDRGHEFVLFSPREFDVPYKLRFMKKVVVQGRVSSLWMQYAMPFLAKLHGIDLFWGPNYSIPLIKTRRLKTVMTIHDMVSFVHPETLPGKTVFHNKYGLPLYCRHVDGILTVSESSKCDLLHFIGDPGVEIAITSLGVRPEFARRSSHTQQVLQQHNLTFPYILCVGTIEPRKNLIRVVQAYARLLKEEGTDHRLVLVGAKGWKFSSLYQLLENDPYLRERVCFLGYVEDKDLPSVYQGASMLVYPSLYEGFGLPPLEAMAAGIPVVASKISSLPEVVGDAGLLVDPYSIEEIAGAMGRILREPDLAEELAAAGKARAAEFTWERTANETMDLFERVISIKR